VVTSAPTKIQVSDSKYTLYLRKPLVGDSAFPFKVKEPLVVRIDGKRLIVERADK